jgi:hypothetical protein
MGTHNLIVNLILNNKDTGDKSCGDLWRERGVRSQ